MRNALILITGLFLIACQGSHLADEAAVDTRQQAIARAHAATLMIHCVKGDESFHATGVTIDPRGYVLTVFASKICSDFDITNGQGERFEFEQFAYSQMPVSLLKVKAKRAMPYIPLREGMEQQLGEDVFTISNALGCGHSFSSGIIAGEMRDIEIQGFKFPQVLFTSIAIRNGGGSGAGLFTSAGDLLAMVFIASAIDFNVAAIPIANVLPNLMALGILRPLLDKPNPRSNALIAAIPKAAPALISIDKFKDGKVWNVGTGISFDGKHVVTTIKPDFFDRGSVIVRAQGGPHYFARNYHFGANTGITIFRPHAQALPIIKAAADAKLDVGDDAFVLIMGTNDQLQVADVIVSAKDRGHTIGLSWYENVLQLAGALNQFHATAPVFDLSGNFIAYNDSVSGSAKGVGFAITAHELRDVAEKAVQEMTDSENMIKETLASFKRAYGLEVEGIVDPTQTKYPRCHRITAIVPGSFAAGTPLKVGDCLLSGKGDIDYDMIDRYMVPALSKKQHRFYVTRHGNTHYIDIPNALFTSGGPP